MKFYFSILCIDARGARLMHIHELAAYPYVLFLFQPPLLAVPCHIE